MSRLGNAIRWRDIDHDPTARVLFGSVSSDLRDGLNGQPIAALIDFDQLPAGTAANARGQVNDRLQRRLGGGYDKNRTCGVGAGSNRRDGCQDKDDGETKWQRT